MNPDEIVEAVKTALIAYVQSEFTGLVAQLEETISMFINEVRDDLVQEINELIHREIDLEEFRSLILGEIELLNFERLKLSTIAEEDWKRFVDGVPAVVVNTVKTNMFRII